MGAIEGMMCARVLQKEHSGDGCDLPRTLCKYHLRKDDCLLGKDVTTAAIVVEVCAVFYYCLL